MPDQKTIYLISDKSYKLIFQIDTPSLLSSEIYLLIFPFLIARPRNLLLIGPYSDDAYRVCAIKLMSSVTPQN